MPDFGFCGASYVAKSIYQEDQECINLYPEIDKLQKGAPGQPSGRQVMALYPTPGLLGKLTLPDKLEVRALHVVPGGLTLYAVCGPSLYAIDTLWNATLVGTLNTLAGQVSIADNGLALYIGDGANRYSYTFATSTLAVISDGAFNGANKVDIVDTFFIYNNPGTNQWGASSALSTESLALSFSSKDSFSDNIISLIADHREVTLLGEVTGEVWTDVGAYPFPFERLPGTMFQHGCQAPFSVARLGESYAWLTTDTRGIASVVKMNGYSPKPISTYAVEYAINQYAVTEDAIGYTYSQSGHEFYVLTFPTQDVTWVYDDSTELWHKRAWQDDIGVLHRHRSNCQCVFNGQIIVGDWENGKIYELDESTYTDVERQIPRIRRCPHLTQDLNRVFYHDLQIQFQPGVGLQTGQGSDPQAMLEWSDDGGSTWSNQHWTTIGQVGKYKNRAIWRRLGQARDRIFQVTVTDPVNAVIISANLNAQAGTS